MDYKKGVSESDVAPYLMGMSVTDGEPEDEKEEDAPPKEEKKWPSYAMPLDLEC